MTRWERQMATDFGSSACSVQSTDPSRNLEPAWQRRRPTTQDTKLHYATAAPTLCSFTQFQNGCKMTKPAEEAK